MKRIDFSLAVALATMLIWAGCSGSPDTSTSRAPALAPSPPEKPAPAIAVESGKPLEILSVLSVERQVDLLAQREGIVVEILKDEGSQVAEGTVLTRLDDLEILAQLDRTRAELESTRFNVKFNESELKANQAAYRRAQEMHKLGLNSDAQLEEAEFKAQGSQYDLEAWRATVERVRADVRRLDIELGKTRIRAPFSGVVARRYIRPGQNVMKDEKCFRLSQLGPLQVHFLVPETSARKAKVGDSVSVVAVSDSQRVYQAQIRKLSPVVDPASGSVDVMAQLTSADVRELRPGMAVRVLWTTASSVNP